MKTIAVLGTLDTKAAELNYIREKIIGQGHHVIVMDLSLSLWDDSPAKPDIGQQQIAEESGIKVEELALLVQEDACTAIIRGATALGGNLYRTGKLDAAIALGGTVGTSMGCAVMRSLPLGVPKVMVSTVVGDIRPYVGTKDIVFFPAITDMFGLNRISKRLLANAAGAIVGMVEADTGSFSTEKPLIGMSVRGDKAPCVNMMKPQLEVNGFEVICFHAVGQGLLMEELVKEGLIAGVLDLVPAEVNEHLFGGMFSAGPDRLEAAGQKGIPQLIAPGSINFVCFPNEKTIIQQFRKRKRRKHNPDVVAIWLNKREITLVAKVMAEKLNLAKGPTAVIIPKKGFCGEGWDIDLGLVSVLTNTLKRELKREIEVVEVNAHINDSSFAKAAVNLFLKLMDKPRE